MSTQAEKLWIRNSTFDLTFVFGGAIFTLLMAMISFSAPSLLPFFFWTWIIVFEGSHFWATISRTYLDLKFRRENFSVLIGSLAFFAIPALAAWMEQLDPTVSYMTIYGFVIFIWSLYHNARQHYGFVSIYSKKMKMDETFKKEISTALYLCIGFSQLYFMFNFKMQIALGSVSWSNSNVQFFFTTLPMILTGLAFAHLLRLSLVGYQKYGKKVFVTLSYIYTCLIFYSVMFFVLAPADKFFQGANGVQTLMLITIMNSLFHNIQYHAIVWHYGQSRYQTDSMKESFGFAHFLNSKSVNYILSSLALGCAFAFIVWNNGGLPHFNGSFDGMQSFTWAYIFLHGIIGHHFYLDQKIWRPSQQTDLANYLK